MSWLESKNEHHYFISVINCTVSKKSDVMLLALFGANYIVEYVN
jgi:hypothetical protein